MALTISPELQSLIPPLSSEEHAQLEVNLLAEGCRDPLVTWKEEGILLDGHHRLQICEQHALDYRIQELSLPDFDAARAWMLGNQLGRRNLSPNQMSYYRGELYNLQKQGHGGDRKSDGSSSQNENLKTVDRLAAAHGVSRATISRDGAYAAAVEVLAAVLGPEARQAILAGQLDLTKQDVPVLAALVAASPETADQVKAALQGEAPADGLRAILTASRCGICHRPLSNPASITRGIGPICAGHGNGVAHSSGVLNGAPALVLEPEDQGAEETTAPATWPQYASSGDPEWYTPDEILDPVREVLGAIDLDPASCDTAQIRVQARTYYTTTDDSLRQAWHGKVFLNPPYKLPEVARFLGKLFEEIEAAHTTEAIVLVNSATETDWFQAAFRQARAVCFPDGRIHFVSPTRGAGHPCQGQALLYYGPNVDHFCVVFAALGVSTRVICADAPQAHLDLAEAPPAPAPDAPDCPPFDTAVYILGKLCKAGHEWGQTGQTRLRIKGRYCPDCNSALKREKRKEQSQAVGAP
jgi:phage N-6-adenine-methyltransferase